MAANGDFQWPPMGRIPWPPSLKRSGRPTRQLALVNLWKQLCFRNSKPLGEQSAWQLVSADRGGQ
jgi:hypothetical protein